MQEPIEMLCHVGLIHHMAFPEIGKDEATVLPTLTRIARDDFFTAVEVTRIKSEELRKQARVVLDSSGMEVIFAGQPPLLGGKLSLNHEDPAERKKAIDACRVSVDQAYQLGAAMLVVLSGPDPGEAKRAAGRELLVDSLNQVCAYAQEKAEDYCLAVTLENFDRTIDKKSLIGPTKEAAEVAAAVTQQYSNFGLTIDLSHQPLLSEHITEMIIDATDYLIHAHMGNCVMRDPQHPAYGDVHPRFGIPGGENGVDELRQFLEDLYYNGFFRRSVPTRKPVISFEIKPLAGEDSELVIANAKRTLREAWTPKEAWQAQ